MTYFIVSNPEIDGARATIHADSLPEQEARGWVVVGEVTGPLETVTTEELEAKAIADAAALDAATAAAAQIAADEQSALDAAAALAAAEASGPPEFDPAA